MIYFKDTPKFLDRSRPREGRDRAHAAARAAFEGLWIPSGRGVTPADVPGGPGRGTEVAGRGGGPAMNTQHATIRLRGLKVATPVAAELVPRDLVPPDGPAGNPTVTLELEGFGPICTATFNGKSYRRMLKALAEHGPQGVTVLLQGTLKPGPGGLPVLEGAGISAVPRSRAAPPAGGGES
jgi:hypothetical protein